MIDNDRTMQNLAPWGEPQLGRRGLYRAVGGTTFPTSSSRCSGYSTSPTGHTSLLDIAERAGLDHSLLVAAAGLLEEHGLLREAVRP